VSELSVEKERLTRLQADRLELEIAATKRKLVARQDIERTWSKVILACRSKLLALPTALAVELADMTAEVEIELLLTRYIKEALTELSYGASFQSAALGDDNEQQQAEPSADNESEQADDNEAQQEAEQEAENPDLENLSPENLDPENLDKAKEEKH